MFRVRWELQRQYHFLEPPLLKLSKIRALRNCSKLTVLALCIVFYAAFKGFSSLQQLAWCDMC